MCNANLQHIRDRERERETHKSGLKRNNVNRFPFDLAEMREVCNENELKDKTKQSKEDVVIETIAEKSIGSKIEARGVSSSRFVGNYGTERTDMNFG